MIRRFILLAACLTLFVQLPLAAQEGSRPLRRVDVVPRIVNGVTTGAFPSTVALVGGNEFLFCTGTLIGCETVLTAAHCLCDLTGGLCQGDGTLSHPPSDIVVYAQHGGRYNVSEVLIPPTYEFRRSSDVALVKLSQPVDGIAPTPINVRESPAVGTPGTIVGFGLSQGFLEDFGVKRSGQVESAACTGLSGLLDPASHLCWLFANPLGPPGTDSDTCTGDSGGPLFMDLGDGQVVAGVTSGGNQGCSAPDEPFDANVFLERQWILMNGGSDLDNETCGVLPQAGTSNAPVFFAEDRLSEASPERGYTVEVPEGASVLRVALNGEDLMDADLFVRAGAPATTEDFDCSSELSGVYEICQVNSPAPGTWHVLAARREGGGLAQVTATVFGTEPTDCTADDFTLCIDDEPGDRRFKITVHVETVLGGGQETEGRAIPLSSLGIRRGGLFWFFDPTNPELLIKVLNGCSNGGHYWVFWSAGTTAGMEVRVEDTFNGRVRTYTNPDEMPAAPVTDTQAFTCNP